MRNIIFILLVIVFGLSACIQAPDFYTIDYPEFAKDIGPANKNVADNIIYQGGKEFVYAYKFLDSLGEEQKFVTFYNYSEKEPLDWKFMPVPLEETLNSEYPIDSIRLKVLRNTSNATQAEQQTMIVYEFFNNFGTIIPVTERTGLTEDSSTVFLFPPRNSGFALLELTPFPQVEYPLEKGNTWIDNLTVSTDWSDAMRIDFESALYLYSEYTVSGQEMISSRFGQRLAWVIDAKAESRMGETTSQFKFDEKLGFMEMTFNFLNGSQLTMELVGVKR